MQVGKLVSSSLVLGSLWVAAGDSSNSNELRAGSAGTFSSGIAPFWDVEIEYQWVPTQQTRSHNSVTITCGPLCRGDVHPAHPSCDQSCDKPCDFEHTLSIAVDAKQSVGDAVGAIHTALGPNETKYISGDTLRCVINTAALQATTSLLKEQNTSPQQIAHWNTAPCTVAGRLYLSRVWDLKATWKLIEKPAAFNGLAQPTERSRGEAVIGYAFITDPTAIFDQTPITRCFCNKTLAHVSADPPKTATGLDSLIDSGTFVDLSTFTSLPPKLAIECKLEITFPNMNECELSGSNPTDKELTIGIPPGCRFEPESDAYQSECNLSELSITLPPNSYASKRITFGPSEFWGRVSQKGLALCLQIGKKEPHSGVKYQLKGGRDPNIGALARFGNKQSMRGVPDQVRMWIYTDTATLKEITERVMPGPTEGRYLNAAHEVALVTGSQFTSGKYARCVEPPLLLGKTASVEAVRWTVGVLANKDAKALTKYVIGNVAKFRNLVESTPRKWEVEYLSALADSLTRSPYADVRKAGIEFISAGVAPGAWSEFAKIGGLDGVGAMLQSETAEEVLGALKIISDQAYKPLTSLVAVVAERAKSPEVKQAAIATLAKLNSK